MIKAHWFISLGIVFFILVANITGCSDLNSERLFFNGKTITIIVPHGSGGGTDTYARTIAPFLQKYLPGSKVQVINVPENGSLTGKNQIYNAEPDGLTLGFTAMSGTLLTEWAGTPGVEYKSADFSLIGRLNYEQHIMAVSPKSGLKNLSDVLARGKISMAFTGLGSDDYYIGMITSNLLGFQVDAKTDFSISSEAALACVKGDVDAIFFSGSSLLSQIAAQTLIPIAVFSQERLPELPNVPTIFEELPDVEQSLMLTLVQFLELDKNLIAPPNIPAARLQALREALDKTVADPEFIQNMQVLERTVNYINGEELSSLMRNILSNEDQIKPLVQELINNN